MRNVSSQHPPPPHPPNFNKELLPEGQGKGAIQHEERGQIPGAPNHSPVSQAAPSTRMAMVRGRFWKKGQGTASAHTLPTETIRELRPWLPSSSLQFGRYFNRGEEFPEAPPPPTEMPHVRECLFSFPLAVNEFYSWQRLGAGSDPHRS